MKVPDSFEKKKYSKLFDYLTTRRYMIPLGLYRTDRIKFMSLKEEDDRNRKRK